MGPVLFSHACFLKPCHIHRRNPQRPKSGTQTDPTWQLASRFSRHEPLAQPARNAGARPSGTPAADKAKAEIVRRSLITGPRPHRFEIPRVPLTPTSTVSRKFPLSQGRSSTPPPWSGLGWGVALRPQAAGTSPPGYGGGGHAANLQRLHRWRLTHQLIRCQTVSTPRGASGRKILVRENGVSQIAAACPALGDARRSIPADAGVDIGRRLIAPQALIAAS
jgi:hypothetical protein